MSPRFYTSLPLALGIVEVTGAEAHHLATVCRLAAGDSVCLFNGDGREYPGRVAATSRRAVLVEVLGVEAPQRELPFAFEVAAPLPKGERGPFLIEKLTELGVTSYVPLSCQRSVVHPGEGKREKLLRHVIEASKQCGRNVLMRVGDVVEWSIYCAVSYCAVPPEGAICLVAHPGGRDSVASALCEVPKGAAVRIAVGPEGGFTDAEIALAESNGWHIIDLGPRILRIETAAVALAVQAVWYKSEPRA